MVGSVRDAVGLASEEAAMVTAQQEPSAQEVLAGLVERVTFHDDENGVALEKTSPETLAITSDGLR